MVDATYTTNDHLSDAPNSLDDDGKTPQEIIREHIIKSESLLNSTMGQQAGITSIRDFTPPKKTDEERIESIQSGLILLQQNIHKTGTTKNDKDAAKGIAERLKAIEIMKKCTTKEK